MANGLAQSGGGRRAVWAFGLGGIAALALAPYYFLPGLVLSLSGFVFLLDGANGAPRPRWSAFFTGWAFGFGYFLVGCYWLAFAFLVQADQFAWMIPIAVPAFTGFLGLFFGLAAAAAQPFWRRQVPRVVALTVALSLAEFVRGHILTGFPWNLLGQAFAGNAVLPQMAAVVGPYGLSLLVILGSALPAAALQRGRWHWPPLLASGMVFASIVGFGAVRLATHPVMMHGEITVAIVQPNVPQRDKLDPEKQQANLQRTIGMTADALSGAGVSYAVWPENTHPFLAQIPEIPQFLASRLPPQTTLVTGTFRSYAGPDGARYGNSAAVFGPTSDGAKPLLSVYDKHHLVPFGEYLPFKGLLQALGLSQLAPVEDGFTPGPGPTTLDAGPKPFAPLICYEDVFPRRLYPADNRPEWLVTVTNDAWFGDNAGPQQHLDISRLRSIESGLPMARSANTGISAMIGPYGRILDQIDLYQAGVVTGPLPVAGARPLYDRFGHHTYFALLVMITSIGWRAALARKG